MTPEDTSSFVPPLAGSNIGREDNTEATPKVETTPKGPTLWEQAKAAGAHAAQVAADAAIVTADVVLVSVPYAVGFTAGFVVGSVKAGYAAGERSGYDIVTGS